MTPRRARVRWLPLYGALLPLTTALTSAGAGAVLVPALPPAVGRASQPIGDSIFPALGQAGLDVQHYDLSLTVLQPGTLTLQAQAVLTLTATRPLPEVTLDFAGPAVSAVRWNGQPVRYRVDLAAQKLRVAPPAPLQPGSVATLSVSYAGLPGQIPDPDFNFPVTLGWQAVAASGTSGGANFTLSEPHGTRSFLPCNDHPSDKATFTTRVTVPVDYTAAASGVQVGQPVTAGRVHTFVFSQRQPIPTYALALHVGRFERVDSPPLPLGSAGAAVQRRDYFPVGTSAGVRAAYAQTAEMMRVLEGWFGPYPFEAYGVAVVTLRLPALETATLSTMPVSSSRPVVALHELAHQWFGNSVTPADWSDVWLSEGLATYAELLWAEAHGEDGQAVAQRWWNSLRASGQASGPDGGTRPLVARRADELFDITAYRRGALAFHALRAAVGDAAFGQFLKSYARRFAGQSIRTADLLSLTRTELGAQAEATLRLWVESPTLPSLP